jgi:hypothetical protein
VTLALPASTVPLRGAHHPLLSIAEITDWLNRIGKAQWTTDKVRDLLGQIEGVLFQPVPGRRKRWYTTGERLAKNFPDIYWELMRAVQREDDAAVIHAAATMPRMLMPELLDPDE